MDLHLRQLRYFVTLAEELHFGRAAAREHIVQSALSRQIQQLERALGTALVERDTHRVRLSEAGEIFLVEARRILDQIDCAAAAARTATNGTIVRVAIGDASLDSMPEVLHLLQDKYPGTVIHQVEAGVPEQLRMLVDGRLDVGFGRASQAGSQFASELLRLDPVGLLVAKAHPLAHRASAPIALLEGEPMLLADESWAPEYNQFICEMCRAAGFTPTVYQGIVQSICAAAQMVARRYCLVCVPRSCRLEWPGTRWVPLVDPVPCYPWSLVWRVNTPAKQINTVLECAREISRQFGWLDWERTPRSGRLAARPR